MDFKLYYTAHAGYVRTRFQSGHISDGRLMTRAVGKANGGAIFCQNTSHGKKSRQVWKNHMGNRINDTLPGFLEHILFPYIYSLISMHITGWTGN